MDLQEAFNYLFDISSKACDADIEMSEEDCNIAMTELWSALRHTKKFYTGVLFNDTESTPSK